ncbi:MAG: hypothetical protein QW051_02500 [Candidatus Aenigmatarchaeota archaeon]
MKSSSEFILIKIEFFLIFLLLLIPIYFVSAAGNFSCSIVASGSCGSGNTTVLYLKNDTGGYRNAHAQNVSIGTYPYVICCASNSSLSYACGEGVFLRLNSTTNSHVQRGNYNGPGQIYGINVCLTANPGYFNCTYVDNSCPSDRECFASMASAYTSENNDTNAHIGPCDEYVRKICCKIVNDPVITYVSPTPSNGARTTANSVTINVTVVSDSSVSVDTCVLEWKVGAGSPTNETMTKRGSGSSVTCDVTKTTTDGTDYTFKVYVNDSSGVFGSSPSRSFRENDEPSKVILSSPANDSHTTNRKPTFQWNAATDADGDTLNYTINISCFPACSDDNRLITDIMTTSYTPTTELKYFGDDGYYYIWSVRAGDGYEYGEWSDPWKLTIDTNVSIIMLNDTVDFGANRPIGYSDDTTDNNPYPFSIRNVGNCFVNVKIRMSDTLWETTSIPQESSYFQYKADWLANEQGAFNWSASQTTWANVPLTDSNLVKKLNYTTGNNSFETDIKIIVPSDEPPGTKSSTLIFSAEYSG